MSNKIEYNGYIGTVEYSQEDKCFFGKLEMINDLVTFEAENPNIKKVIFLVDRNDLDSQTLDEFNRFNKG